MGKKDEASKPRMSSVERLELQLKEAKAKAASGLQAKYDKAHIELNAALAQKDRAEVRVNKAMSAIDEIVVAASEAGVVLGAIEPADSESADVPAE